MSTITTINLSNESGIKSFVRRNQLMSLYIGMFLLAWPVLILDALGSQGYVAKPPMILEFATGLTPAIAAIIVTSILDGGKGVRNLLSKFLVWRVGGRWYLVGSFLMAIVILGGIGLHVLFGGARPAIPALTVSPLVVVFAFVVTVVLGFLFNTEEVAWRGFALPRLQAKYSVLTACVMLAIPEALFHLPYFWNQDIAFYQTVGMFWFTAFSIAAVFLYVFIFNKTKGSLLIVTLLHSSQNAWANLLSDNSLRPFQFTVALMWMIALAVIFATQGQLGYETEK